MRSSIFKILSVGLLLAAVSLFPAGGLRALGLGEARVDSYLGQPLDVSIRLVEPEGGAIDSLTVESASPQDYDRLGIPSNALGLGLEVTVDRRIDPPLVRVRSSREVTDPVVQVLIDARWASGRVLREYTLFLDPPTLPVAPPIRRVDESTDVSTDVSTEADTPEPGSVEPAAQAQPAPATSRPAPRPAIEPARAEPSPAATPEPASPRSEPEPMAASTPSRTSRTVGPIAPGQTLWSIASAWRPSTGLTMNQVMLAILDQNPQAFIDGNVNQLRRNAVLNMPSSDDIASIEASDADRRMQAQMMAWQPMAASTAVPVISDDAVPEVMDDIESEPARDIDDGNYRLEVVPPEGETVEDLPSVSDSEIEEANRRLTELEDQFYIEGLENDELYRQVEDIRDAIEARDMAGLAVANEELANLESRLRAAREERAIAEELAAREEAAREEAALAEAAADESADGAVDQVDEYFRDLEDELGVAGDDSMAASADDDSVMIDESLDGSADMTESMETMPADEATGESQTESESQPEATRPITVVGSDRDGGLSAWLWALIGGALILVVGIGLFIWNMLRKRPDDRSQLEPTLGLDDLRMRVAEEPGNLDAHLALLNGLAMTDNEDRFSDALDEMYAEVDDDNDPRWQDALNLAVMNAPDHPLLTPHEASDTGAEDTIDGLDDRTREMLGILDRPENESIAESDRAGVEEIEATLDLADESDETDALFDEDSAETDKDSVDWDDSSKQGAREASGDADSEFDLAALSNRLDDHEKPAKGSEFLPADLEFDAPDSSDDGSRATQADAAPQSRDASGPDDLDLDFEFSSEEELQSDSDALSLDELDGTDDEAAGPGSADDEASPADTLDLSGESASNDTVRMDPDELAALSSKAEEDDDDDSASATIRADDTLDLVSNSDLDFEDVGDRELEAFLAEGDDIVDSDDAELMADDEAASILDSDEPEPDDAEEGRPELSDDDADVKLDLAQAYLSMDDPESARTLLDEIVSGGSRAKRARAQDLLDRI